MNKIIDYNLTAKRLQTFDSMVAVKQSPGDRSGMLFLKYRAIANLSTFSPVIWLNSSNHGGQWQLQQLVSSNTCNMKSTTVEMSDARKRRK